MREYDLVVRGGTLVDGSGLAPYRADVGIRGDRIVRVGRIRERGSQEVDADGHVVTPGFVDGHTHLDAQVFWDPLGTSSCWHGVTSVVMGNCGFTLAPSRPGQPELVVRNLERAEDIPAETLAEGIPEWSWEHAADYLAVVDRLPKGINYAAYVGHSALRTWAMGERAFEEPATTADLDLMARELRAALEAGAVGFSTSRSDNHKTSDDRPVASRQARWDEVVALVEVVGDSGGGVVELANESIMSSPDPAERAESMGRLRALAVDSGVPLTFGVTSFGNSERWREQLDLIDATAAAGGRMFGQSSGRESDILCSFKSWLPFDHIPEWQELRRLPLDDQAAVLRRPEDRRRLVEAAHQSASPGVRANDPRARGIDFESICVVRQAVHPNPSVASVARERDVDPVELMVDLALESDFEQFFARIIGNADPVEVQTILQHPRTVMTFSDSGAHVSQGINASLPTHLLAYWVREREILPLEEAVRMLTLVPASLWGLPDRGLVRQGFAADLNVFDPGRLAPDVPTLENDLPGGAKRLKQTATGILATVVNGEVVLREGEHTGALPGMLLRWQRD